LHAATAVFAAHTLHSAHAGSATFTAAPASTTFAVAHLSHIKVSVVPTMTHAAFAVTDGCNCRSATEHDQRADG
jgi:hypothetical protein